MINIKSVLTTLFNNIIEIKNTKYDIDKVKNIHKIHPLQYVATKDSSYSTLEIYNVYLVGNTLRIYFKANRSSATGTGDITNDPIFTIRIYTQGLFRSLYNTVGINYIYGVTHNFSTADRVYGTDDVGEYAEFVVQMNATHGGIVGTDGLLFTPVLLNTDKY